MGAVMGVTQIHTVCMTGKQHIVDDAEDMPSFPGLLGPFAVVSTPFQTDDFRIIPRMFGSDARPPLMGEDNDGIDWAIEKAAMDRVGLDIGDRHRIRGCLSPRSPVTLKSTARGAVRIPARARTFVWSYPVEDWQSIAGGSRAAESADSFLSVGGFVYMDQEYKVVGINTLMALTNEATTKTMHFDEPMAWDPEWTEYLVKHKRLHLITLKAMVLAGARYFCWLRPGEVFLSASKQPYVPHGGFVYLFGAQPGEAHPHDRYFAMTLEADIGEDTCIHSVCMKTAAAAVPFGLQDQKKMKPSDLKCLPALPPSI